MIHPFVRIALNLFAAIGAASACFAATDPSLRFELESKKPGEARLRIDRDGQGDRHGSFSSNYAMRELSGLSPAAFLGPSPAALRFTLTAPAGSIACSGSGSHGLARGDCVFRPDPSFAVTLKRHGYAAPTLDEGVTLAAVRFDPEVLDALDQSGFRRGTTADLAPLAIFRIDGRRVRATAAAGYRPAGLKELVHMTVLGVSPEFIAGFAAAGYRDLTADQLVQLKLFHLTAVDARTADQRAGHRLATDELIRRKMLGGLR